jgi:hypothetical protein
LQNVNSIRTGYWNVSECDVQVTAYYRAVAWHKALSREFVTAQAWVCSCLRPYVICGGQSESGTGFGLSELQFLPVSIIPPTPHTHVSLTNGIAHLY